MNVILLQLQIVLELLRSQQVQAEVGRYPVWIVGGPIGDRRRAA